MHFVLSYKLYFPFPDVVGRDSVVGIQTRYRLGGQGIECRCGRSFPHLSGPALGPNQPVAGLFLWDKSVEVWP
jgi:hypothetical protein